MFLWRACSMGKLTHWLMNQKYSSNQPEVGMLIYVSWYGPEFILLPKTLSWYVLPPHTHTHHWTFWHLGLLQTEQTHPCWCILPSWLFLALALQIHYPASASTSILCFYTWLWEWLEGLWMHMCKISESDCKWVKEVCSLGKSSCNHCIKVKTCEHRFL